MKRVKFTVGVAYSSDVQKVIQLLKEYSRNYPEELLTVGEIEQEEVEETVYNGSDCP